MRLNSFSERQADVFKFMQDDNRYLICDGAVRSGKTVCMILGFVLWAMSRFDNCSFAVCGKTIANVERNVITPFLTIDGVKRIAEYKRANHSMVVSVNGKTNTFYLFGGKDESSYMLIQGLTLAGILLDEVALMPRSFVEQAIARTLTYKDAKIWFNCNPEGSMHWFNREWIIPADKGERTDVKHLHFLMSDNPIMGADEIEKSESMFSGVFYQRYILGLWVMSDGLIYDGFNKDVHVLNSAETEGDYFVSCDYGIQNATVFLLWRKQHGTNNWVCLNEYYYSGRDSQLQKTVDAHCDGLEAMLGDIVPKSIIVDPSASALIVELRRRKYHVQKADNDVIEGISDVSTMIRQNRLLFLRNCKHTIEEFAVYCWDKKAADRGEDRPIKENDHAMDAVRYMVRTRHLIKPRQEYKPLY